jgi:hypothetical protein
MRVFIRVATGIVLCAAGIMGGVYSIRTSRAQSIYYSVKYGSLTNAAPDVVLNLCEDSFRLYPHSHDLSIQACLKMWSALSSENESEAETAINSIQLWSDRGMQQNRYHRTLNQIKADMISLESTRDAADYWMGFVDNQFWSSRNIALLVKYYARAGRLAEASELLELLKGHAKYKEAETALHEAWAIEMRSIYNQ